MTLFLFIYFAVMGAMLGAVAFMAIWRPKPGCAECRAWDDERKRLKSKLRQHMLGAREQKS